MTLLGEIARQLGSGVLHMLVGSQCPSKSDNEAQQQRPWY